MTRPKAATSNISGRDHRAAEEKVKAAFSPREQRKNCQHDGAVVKFPFTRSKAKRKVMIELLRTNDVVLISVVESLLREAGVYFLVADQNMSVLEGSAGFLPRRIWVADDQAETARRLLREAGLAGELS
jgi:hypothetical protein